MRPFRSVATALAAAALLSGCGPESNLRLNLRTVAITVPRAIAPAVELVPPSASPAVALPRVARVVDQLPADAAPIATADEPCPTAPALAVPQLAASLTVDDAPAAQAFVQRADGEFATTDATGSLDGEVQVTITRLSDTTASTGQTVKSWRVQQLDPGTDTRVVEVYQLVQPSNAPNAIASGVYLMGLAWSDPVRGELAFEPAGNGLFVLPSPVQVAQNDAQYAGIATDPDTLTTMQLTRNVRGRERIDVCGELVDTWTVEMSGLLTTPSAQWNLTWKKHFATAYGAVDVDEVFTVEDVTGGVSWSRHIVSTSVPKEIR
jgi:hypothetical protein